VQAIESINNAMQQKRVTEGLEVDVSMYIDLSCVMGTSDIVERCFSLAKRVLSDGRLGMSPYMFEVIMFLKMNMEHWIAHDVALAIQNSKRNARERFEGDEY
jgi:hypothetical protein